MKGFAVTSENYKIVVNILKEKYGQGDLVKVSLYQHMHSVHPISKCRSFCAVVEIEQILRQLEAQREDVDIHSPLNFGYRKNSGVRKDFRKDGSVSGILVSTSAEKFFAPFRAAYGKS